MTVEIELSNEPPKPVREPERKIKVDGKCIGSITHFPDSMIPYLASTHTDACTLWGHGKTPEEALAHMISQGVDRATKSYNLAISLANKLQEQQLWASPPPQASTPDSPTTSMTPSPPSEAAT